MKKKKMLQSGLDSMQGKYFKPIIFFGFQYFKDQLENLSVELLSQSQKFELCTAEPNKKSYVMKSDIMMSYFMMSYVMTSYVMTSYVMTSYVMASYVMMLYIMKYLYKPCTFNQKVTFGKYFPCPDHSGPYDG